MYRKIKAESYRGCVSRPVPLRFLKTAKSDYTGTTTSEVDLVKYPFGCAMFDYMVRQVPLSSTREDPMDTSSLW